jgi:hypothetical protein
MEYTHNGQIIIIPSVRQIEILGKLHATHQSAEKTKFRARTSGFWRKMNEDIDRITNHHKPDNHSSQLKFREFANKYGFQIVATIPEATGTLKVK